MPREYLSFKGRLGLTHSPGSEEDSREADLSSLRGQGVDHIICLQEEDEFWRFVPPEDLRIRREAVEAFGMQFSAYPIEDFKAPDLDLAMEILEALTLGLRSGQTVALHCLAGLGRAGTLAACLFVREGMSGDSALQLIRWLRPGAVQSKEQEALISVLAAKNTSS